MAKRKDAKRKDAQRKDAEREDAPDASGTEIAVGGILTPVVIAVLGCVLSLGYSGVACGSFAEGASYTLFAAAVVLVGMGLPFLVGGFALGLTITWLLRPLSGAPRRARTVKVLGGLAVVAFVVGALAGSGASETCSTVFML